MMEIEKPDGPADVTVLDRLDNRREFIRKAAAGTVLVALGGTLLRLAAHDLTRAARAQKRPDGRPRLPPGQRMVEALKPMGGRPGPTSRGGFRLRIHGEVDRPLDLAFDELVAAGSVETEADVHCVTGWSLLGGLWTGVRLADLADRAGVKSTARHVIFEGAHGYTANVRIANALKPNVLLAHRLGGRPLRRGHGAPVRALVPDLYFWKSTKWLTGVRFVRRDQPGYWEQRGYHNRANPWREERHA